MRMGMNRTLQSMGKGTPVTRFKRCLLTKRKKIHLSYLFLSIDNSCG